LQGFTILSKMSKTTALPWFKMPPSIVLHPKFQKMTIAAQAGYMTLCSTYWQDEGVMTVEDAEDLCDEVGELILKGYVVETADRHLEIEFLREQLEEQGRVREKRVEAGRKGGQARAKQVLSKSQASAKQTASKVQAEKSIVYESILDEKKVYEKDKKEAPAYAVVLPWETDSFLHIWNIWCKFRTTELNKPKYKEMGEQAALKKLREMAGGDEATAHKIIEQSIANAWQGLFELKTNKANYNGKRQPVTGELLHNLEKWASDPNTGLA
jgi:hypothetical protein